MRLITAYIPRPLIDMLDNLVSLGKYPSRSSAVREGIKKITPLKICQLEPTDMKLISVNLPQEMFGEITNRIFPRTTMIKIGISMLVNQFRAESTYKYPVTIYDKVSHVMQMTRLTWIDKYNVDPYEIYLKNGKKMGANNFYLQCIKNIESFVLENEPLNHKSSFLVQYEMRQLRTMF